MQFERIKKETIILNPQKDMAEQRIPSEIRLDPLTGRTARICHFMKLHWEKPDFRSPDRRNRGLVSLLRGKGADRDPLFSPRTSSRKAGFKKTIW